MPRRRFHLVGLGVGGRPGGCGRSRTDWAGIQRWHVARWGRKQGRYTASGARGQAVGVGEVLGTGAAGAPVEGRKASLSLGEKDKM